uniref:Cytochrome P450 3029B1 n=1 Tax=Paracyclopina nana TaxID=565004 RepID=A0A0F7J2S6_PARNA|nr:cytochrome P450 3029B1 [Paracyclopina nana]
MSPLFMVGAAIAAILIISILKTSIRPRNFPPGPIGLPLVGHIPFIDAKNVGRSCKKLGKKYGDIFSIFLGTKPVVVLNSWPVIKEAFSKKEFSGRPGMFSGTFFQKGQTGICTTEGEAWEAQRTFFHDHLQNMVKGKGSQGFHDIIMDEVHDIRTELAKKVGEPIAPSYVLNIGIINILWTVASGRRLHSQQQEFQSVYECIEKITQFMSKAAIMSFMPFLARILPEAITKMERGRYFRDRFVAISEKWIEEHKQEYRGNRTGDLTDSYMAKIKEGTPYFTEKGLGAMLREMFVIGAESESVMLRWAVRILSVHTEAQRKIQAEIDSVVGVDKDVTWDDRFNLPYTRAAMAEIQRFADIAPTAVGHKCLYDVDFHGFHLPKGTGVVANLTACHRDPAYWKNPEKYQPEHFLDEQGQFIEDKDGFVPFGSGIRRCPGEDLANIEMFLVLANLLKAFVFRTPENDDKSVGTYYKTGTGVLRNPKPYYVVLENRT